MTIILRFHTILYVEAKDDVTLVFHDKSSLTLKKCIYVPKIRRNITLTYYLYEDVFHTDFSNRGSIMKNDREVFQAPAVNRTYVLHPKILG